jgi:asparagine synthase (glutamine-hydrolysing)
MCGFLSVFSSSKLSSLECDQLKVASDSLRIRGRDQENICLTEDGHAFYRHNRLIIIGSDHVGVQPVNSDQYNLLFNGEIYNYKSLARQFKISDNGSDTQVLFDLLVNTGLDNFLNEVDGPFAFCFRDNKLDQTIIARDRFGERPLFYYKDKNILIVSSHGSVVNRCRLILTDHFEKLSQRGMLDTLIVGYVPGKRTVFENVFKLRPGEIIRFDHKGANSLEVLDNLTSSDELIAFNECFEKSLKNRFVADVPIGLFLSGGIDSSAVAVACKKNDLSLASYTLGFKDSLFDESKQAENFAKGIGIDISVIMATGQDLIDFYQSLLLDSDLPITDTSSVTLGFLAEKTKNEIKVAISGDGGDELYYGYGKYQALNWIDKMGPFKYIFTNKALLHTVLNTGFLSSKTNLSNKLNKISNLIRNVNSDFFYSSTLTKDLDLYKTYGVSQEFKISGSGISALRNADLGIHLPDYLLMKSDMAGLHSDIEIRTPFLNKDVLSHSNSLDYKKEMGKKTLKEYISNFYPKFEVTPKKGFGLPLESYFFEFFKSSCNLKTTSLERVADACGISDQRLLQLLENDKDLLLTFRVHSIAYWLER